METLIPFDLEQAKADPSRVRHFTHGLAVGKPFEVRFAGDWVIIQFERGQHFPGGYASNAYDHLRLTEPIAETPNYCSQCGHNLKTDGVSLRSMTHPTGPGTMKININPAALETIEINDGLTEWYPVSIKPVRDGWYDIAHAKPKLYDKPANRWWFENGRWYRDVAFKATDKGVTISNPIDMRAYKGIYWRGQTYDAYAKQWDRK